MGLLLKNNWYGAPKKMVVCSKKTGGAAGKKIGDGTAVAEPAPEAPERGLKGAPTGCRSTSTHLFLFLLLQHLYDVRNRFPFLFKVVDFIDFALMF
tara:strand:+ start:483 stop:770 length:288 start_codon:yes stop_codon:yes gene_type:complete